MGRRVLIIIAGFLIAAVLLGYGFSIWGRGDVLIIYYYDSSENVWATESYATRITGLAAAEAGGLALDRLERLPEQNSSWKSLPGTYVADGALDERIFTVRFTPEFDTLSRLDKNIAVSSIVYTLTEIPGIDSVIFYVGDTEFTLTGTLPGPVGRDRLFINTELLPDNVSTTTITLYFLNTEDNMLTAVERRVEVHPNRPMESIIVEELIAGPDSEGQIGLIPNDVRLREDVRMDTGICYVDFTTDFLIRYDSEENLTLAINSIVNTLNANTGANQVQLLFAGDKTTAQHSTIDLGGPISRN